MKCNTALWDRCLRFVVGVLLVTYAVAGGPSWMYFGIYLLITAAWGLCPVYLIFNIRTLNSKSVVKRF
ncbi:MAG: DUF2892 domain-containing protein [Bdellovibrionaceae bacterium]|nr:DUF2892 domain-containing protein [Pseudobdellovibrionaceae bacterium]